MSDITIKFKDGTERKFPHEGRAGGSYSKSVSYEGGFVIVKDEWYNTFAFPTEVVAEVQTKEQGGW
jgi:hypothetical protein